MRPDPYKRARSRQYKIKHGLFDHVKLSNPQSNLPSNIFDDILSLALVSEGILDIIFFTTLTTYVL